MDRSHDILIKLPSRRPPDIKMTEQALKTVNEHRLKELGVTETPDPQSPELALAAALERQGYGRLWQGPHVLLTARGLAHQLIQKHNLPTYRGDEYAARLRRS